MTLDDVRAWYAENLRVTMALGSSDLVAALATVPRERFVGPGPWTIVGGRNIRPRATDSDDPRHVYHDVSIALDLGRRLYNGQPGLLASWIDELAIRAGDAVLHIGCGTGYYTALLAHVVGPRGRVVAFEVDPPLADRAAVNLAPWPWVEVRRDDGRTNLPSGTDAVLVNAGATHPLDAWLDSTADGGRLLVPLTVAMPGGTIGKGVVLVATRSGDAWQARLGSLVMIYSLVAGRDETLGARLGRALQTGSWSRVTRIRRDEHTEEPACWLHGSASCLSS